MGKLKLAIFILAVAWIFSGCLENLTEVPLDVPDSDLGIPRVVVTESGSNCIKLSWGHIQGATSYRVYRASEPSNEFNRIAETRDTLFTDSEVRNGVAYSYKVAAVGASGLEGKLSEAVSAVPSIYGITINSGQKYTNSKTFTLSLTAPESTVNMILSLRSDLSQATWERFSAQKVFPVESDDGSVTVYARFLDATGTISAVVSDDIILDTYARISGIEIEPSQTAYSPGSTVKVLMRVDGNETGGQGIIYFGSEISAQLRDDGRAGDDTANDGVYSVEYRFPQTLRGRNIPLGAEFTDVAGNRAPYLEGGSISFTDPPMPVQLIGVLDSSQTSITIKWAASTDEHFSAYRIYRSTAPGVSEIPANLIRELSNPLQTSYPDGELEEGRRYYYRIFVVNDLQETGGSNELAASTFDAYPTPPVLDSPSAIGETRLTLTWSVNPDTDFEEYRIYRGTSAGVTNSSTLVATITERELTFFDDQGLDTISNTYYYRIYVYDRGGKFSRSNEVSSR